MVYGDVKDLPRRIPSDTVLLDKKFNVAKNLRYNGYNGWFTIF